MNRILVVGDSGSGKSTVAELLARRLGLAFIELDALYHLPGWQAPEDDVFRAKLRAALDAAPEGWVLAGNYFDRQDWLAWHEADTVVWLDLPLPLTTWRTFLRSWQRWRGRELLWGTNHERFWPQFLLWNPEQSVVAHTLRSHGQRRHTLVTLMAGARWPKLRWVRLRSPREVREWLAALPVAAPASSLPDRTRPRSPFR